jgi:hypothetical protein
MKKRWSAERRDLTTITCLFKQGQKLIDAITAGCVLDGICGEKEKIHGSTCDRATLGRSLVI